MSLLALADSAPLRGRVVHLITCLDRGGSADNTLLTCLGLDDIGWDVTLAHGPTTDPSPVLAEVARRESIRRVTIPRLVRPIEPLSDALAYRALRRLLARGRFDIVHTHSSKAGMLGRRAARGHGARVVHTPHGHVFEGYFGPLASAACVRLERIAAGWCDRIVVLTDRGREEHVARGVGRHEQFVTIHSGVRLAALRSAMPRRAVARRAAGLPRDAYVVGCVARLAPVKGHAVLLRAMASLCARFPELRLLLVGDGEERVALQARARRPDLCGRVIFTGAGADVRTSLAAMDLFVMPSLNEGQSRAVVEAMAAGVPVVASRVGGLSEVLDHGRAGRLVSPGDSIDLAGAIEELITAPQAAAAIAEAGRLRAARYDERSMVDRISTLYQELLWEVTG
jgi:glycosyltransferase involved in cell wall biosynthesis